MWILDNNTQLSGKPFCSIWGNIVPILLYIPELCFPGIRKGDQPSQWPIRATFRGSPWANFGCCCWRVPHSSHTRLNSPVSSSASMISSALKMLSQKLHLQGNSHSFSGSQNHLSSLKRPPSHSYFNVKLGPTPVIQCSFQCPNILSHMTGSEYHFSILSGKPR